LELSAGVPRAAAMVSNRNNAPGGGRIQRPRADLPSSGEPRSEEVRTDVVVRSAEALVVCTHGNNDGGLRAGHGGEQQQFWRHGVAPAWSCLLSCAGVRTCWRRWWGTRLGSGTVVPTVGNGGGESWEQIGGSELDIQTQARASGPGTGSRRLKSQPSRVLLYACTQTRLLLHAP